MINNQEQRIKNSFSKVKNEIDTIKNQLKALDTKITQLIQESSKTTTHHPKDIFFDISSGNEGVINNQQQSTTINNDNQKPIISLKKELNDQFKNLTDREFSIFLAIYSIEEEIGKAVVLSDIANKLKISEITIRGYLNSLISKNLPIIKERPFNRKLQLSITKEFRDLTLISRIISIRNRSNTSQKTLFDT